ncbi:Exodeoxyribonuclease VII small subunit [hydrothermal vent metagenome]|uniref:Exodeoxyribonuclease VII small subunit n=1 Tax=hydrothermal vent metagenome TaxID=652676 RepID=A0A1W1C4Y7_9ZZZZ
MTKKFDFNKGLDELEAIVNKMEDGELSLDESLNYFEKGIKLSKRCHQALSDAEQRILKLTSDDNYTKKVSL